jgi:hypothetical protein
LFGVFVLTAQIYFKGYIKILFLRPLDIVSPGIWVILRLSIRPGFAFRKLDFERTTLEASVFPYIRNTTIFTIVVESRYDFCFLL